MFLTSLPGIVSALPGPQLQIAKRGSIYVCQNLKWHFCSTFENIIVLPTGSENQNIQEKLKTFSSL